MPPEKLDKRLTQQFAFLTEVDRLKTVLRATPIYEGSRVENSGEHSWHVALFAMVLAEHAAQPIRVDRVIKMLLIHDLVEIDAGDTPIHGDFDQHAQDLKEQEAADRIFGLLPAEQEREFRDLWDEFEAAQSDDAIFAKSIDRVQPVLANLANDGGTWPEYNVTPAQLETRVGAKVTRGAPSLWHHLKSRIDAWFSNAS
ncbi:MAG: HD domain-containing protein [Litoreibacter sp.]